MGLYLENSSVVTSPHFGFFFGVPCMKDPKRDHNFGEVAISL